MSRKKILIIFIIVILLIYPVWQIVYFLYLESNSSKNGEDTALSRSVYTDKLNSLIQKYGYANENFDNVDNRFGFDIKVDNDLLVSISNWYDVEYIEILSFDTEELISTTDSKKIDFIADAYNLFALYKIPSNEIKKYVNSLKIDNSGVVSGNMKKLTLSNKIYFEVLDNQFHLQGITN